MNMFSCKMLLPRVDVIVDGMKVERPLRELKIIWLYNFVLPNDKGDLEFRWISTDLLHKTHYFLPLDLRTSIC